MARRGRNPSPSSATRRCSDLTGEVRRTQPPTDGVRQRVSPSASRAGATNAQPSSGNGMVEGDVETVEVGVGHAVRDQMSEAAEAAPRPRARVPAGATHVSVAANREGRLLNHFALPSVEARPTRSFLVEVVALGVAGGAAEFELCGECVAGGVGCGRS